MACQSPIILNDGHVLCSRNTYPVEVPRVDKVRRAEPRQPGEEVPDADGRPDRPRPQPRAGQLRRDGVRRVADGGVVRELVQRHEGDERPVARRAPDGVDAPAADGHAQHPDALQARARRQDGAAAHDVPHEVDADVDAGEAEARVEYGVAERGGRGESRDDEEVGAVADDEPRPGPDLAEDGGVAQQRAAPVDGAAELVQGTDGARVTTLLGDAAHHLGPLEVELLGPQGAPAQAGEGGAALGEPPAVDEVARRLGDAAEAGGEGGGDDEEDADGDLVAGAVEAGLGGVGDDGADDAADVDPLGEEGDEDGAEVGGARLGDVDVGEGDEEAVADAEDEAPEVDDPPGGGADLDGAAGGGEEAGEPEGRLAAEEARKGAGGEGGEEGAEGEEGADELLERALRLAEEVVSIAFAEVKGGGGLGREDAYL